MRRINSDCRHRALRGLGNESGAHIPLIAPTFGRSRRRRGCGHPGQNDTSRLIVHAAARVRDGESLRASLLDHRTFPRSGHDDRAQVGQRARRFAAQTALPPDPARLEPAGERSLLNPAQVKQRGHFIGRRRSPRLAPQRSLAAPPLANQAIDVAGTRIVGAVSLRARRIASLIQ